MRKVDHDGDSVGDLGFSIDEVWHVWEVEAKVVLDGGPALDREVWRVSLLVHHIFVGVLNVLEQVADRVGQSSDLPVAKLNLRILGVQLLPVDLWLLFFGSESSRVFLDNSSWLLSWSLLFRGTAGSHFYLNFLVESRKCSNAIS